MKLQLVSLRKTVVLILGIFCGLAALEWWRTKRPFQESDLPRVKGNAQGQSLPDEAVKEKIPRLNEDEHRELMRLRNEVSTLRQKIKNYTEPAEPVASEPTPPTGEDAGQAASLTVTTLKVLVLATRACAILDNGKYPSSLEEIERVIGVNLNKEKEQFQMFTRFRPLRTNDHKILIAEKVPRFTPNRNWTKIYGMADGTTVQMNSPTGDFLEFETAHTATPSD